MARILIVDDRAGSRELERVVLESLGHEVVEASSGSEAIAAALPAIPDLVLFDLLMPHLDGFATLPEFRKQPQLAPVLILALTASAMRGDDRGALEAEFSGYIDQTCFSRRVRNRIRSFFDSNGSKH